MAAAVAAAAAASHLDALLLAPPRRHIGDRQLVVVPTGAPHALPWALPHPGRSLTVAPSAGHWHRAATSDQTTSGAVLIAGPGLAHGVAEIDAVARRYPDSVRFGPEEATTAAVLGALSGVGLAHIAAHGEFRGDNPLFSCPRLADGPLTVYDLERLERPPALLILSACESGLSGVRPGDEVR